MVVITPGGGGGDNHDDQNGPMDVGVDVEDLSRYHCIKDSNGDDGGNGIVPFLSIVGRGKLHGRQKGTTSLTENTALTSNPNMTFLSVERFYRALNNVMVAAVASYSSYCKSKGLKEKHKTRIIKRRRIRRGR